MGSTRKAACTIRAWRASFNCARVLWTLVLLGGWVWAIGVQAQPPDVPSAISREVSVFVGAEPSPPYTQAISREIAVFVGAEPSPPHAQAISREIAVFVNAGSGSSLLAGAPAIERSPTNVVIALGDPLGYEVIAQGTAPLRYQWRLNEQAIPGATNATYLIPQLRLEDAGRYTALVVNEAGWAQSLPAVVRVKLPILGLVDPFATRPLFQETKFAGVTDNTSAGTEPGEPAHAGKAAHHSLWLTWRPPASGIATFRTAGSSFDTVLAVYTGTAFDTLTLIAGNDDVEGGFLTSQVQFNAIEGIDYSVAVAGFGDASGEVVLSWDLELTPDRLPEIALQPAGRLLPLGQPLELEIAATPADVTYEWWLNGRPLPAEEAPRLVRIATTLVDAGTYRVRVQGRDGRELESEAAVVELSTGVGPGVLSADKLEDLFALHEGGLRRMRAGTLGGGGVLPISPGVVGGQLGNTRLSTRSQNDPTACDAIGGVSRWFRFRFASARHPVWLTTEGSAFRTVLAVYTNRFALSRVVCDVTPPTGGYARVVIPSPVVGEDYLVMVDGVEGASGAFRLNWITANSATLDGEAFWQTGLVGNRLFWRCPVEPGRYGLEQSPRLGGWTERFRTNMRSGVFEFHDPVPAAQLQQFYRLNPLR